MKRIESDDRTIRRRDVLAAAGALAAVAGASLARAGEHQGHEKQGGSGGRGEPRYFEAKAYKKRATLVGKVNECVAKGQACLSHCMETFLQGDTTMAECAVAVQEMLAVCGAMAQVAANDSKNLKAVSQACIAVCETCETICREHEKHQVECKECADACAALIREARKVAA